MKNLVIYIHGKGGSISEAEFYKDLFINFDVTGFDYKSNTPWDAKEEFTKYLDDKSKSYEKIDIIANSIGAFFLLYSTIPKNVEKVFFISPICNMVKLISDMMLWVNVSEDMLEREKEIPTSFGETLSWEYFNYVRNHQIEWKTKTYILYGENDNLQSIDTINDFAKKTGSKVTIMENGEHWFHTENQMEFIKKWIVENIG